MNKEYLEQLDDFIHPDQGSVTVRDSRRSRIPSRYYKQVPCDKKIYPC